MDMIFAVMAKPRVTTFAWDGVERLTEVGNDRFVMHVWTPVALAEGLLRMGCQTDDIPPGMAEGFAAAVIREWWQQPFRVRADQIQSWARRWRRGDG